MIYDISPNGAGIMNYCTKCNWWTSYKDTCSKCDSADMIKALPMQFKDMNQPCLPLVFQNE